MRRFFDTEGTFDPGKPVVAFTCGKAKDCGVRFLKQPKTDEPGPPTPIWCSECGDMKLDTKPVVQLGLMGG